MLRILIRSRLPANERPTNPTDYAGRTARGQTLVEFALVLPMLLVLLLGIADFGRVFATGITMEAAARNAAEAAAQEYVQMMRNRSTPLDATEYDRLHNVAIESVCGEARLLPTRVVGGTGDCDDISSGTADLQMPFAAVCVHDGVDPSCTGAQVANAPAECARMQSTTWDPSVAGYDPAGTLGPLPHVEVQICYRFTTLMNLTDVELPLGWGLSLGEIWMERNREFVAACYQQVSGPCN